MRHPLFIALTPAVFSLIVWNMFVLKQARDPQGEATSICLKKELGMLPNGDGMMISAHEALCDGFGSSSTVYVHIHPTDQAESPETLVFHYEEDNSVEGLNAEPLDYRWLNPHTVQITVGSISSQPSKQLVRIYGIDVVYEIKHIEPLLIVRKS